jgi:Family of unknown function (DUF5977)
MRKLFFRTVITCGICHCLVITSRGQANPENFSKMADFLPPSPNAAALGKYGGVAINYNTGLPNISIPLVAFKSHQLTFSASLQYSSGGIKVDETASRTGMGWVLNAGGVINRSVMGVADELANKRYLIPSPNTSGWQFYDIAKQIANGTSSCCYDGQPDIFSYNFAGYSGRFVFDTLMNVKLIPHTNFKVEKNFSGTDWNFKITTPDGIKYFFGGDEAKETSKRESAMNCGKNYDAYMATAWYLKKIEHPLGDLITLSYTALNFQYDNGHTETMYSTPVLSGCSPSSCATLQNQNCTLYVRVNSVLLNEVQSSNFGKIKFYYSTRSDCGDRLVSKVELIDRKKNTILDSYELTYGYYGTNNIPYLIKVAEKSSTTLKGKEYQMYYYDPVSRAGRLSNSQDHWGYYNGKVNSTLVQRPADVPTQQKFPFATADRAPDVMHTVKGMLSSIRYPTGGKDSLTYEANVYWDVASGANKATGALRVKTISTEDGHHPPIIKRYYYADVIDLNKSSALIPGLPNYQKSFRSRNYCNPGYSYCDYIALYSNSLNSLFEYTASPISYVSVIESHGANFENGGTQYKFLAGADAKGQILLNDEIMNAPYSNFGYLNGKLTEQTDFRKSGSVYTYLKKTTNTYKIDSRKSYDRISWIVNRKFEEQGGVSVPPANPFTWELEALDVMRYDMMSRWVYVDTTREIVYDQNGLNPVTTVTTFFYDNENNLMLTRTEKQDSKLNLAKTNHTYPHNYPGIAVYDTMVARHIIAPMVEFKTLNNTTTTSITQTNYTLTPTTIKLAVPGDVKKSFFAGALEAEGTFDKYDIKGNLLQFTGKDGLKVCYVWGYGHLYVVAKIVGADFGTVLTKVDTATLQSITDETTLRNTLNNLRTISGAFVTTFTHRPQVGVKSETDPNNRTTYNEYDALGRLVLVRDKDQNIIKKVCYNYTGQTEYCNIYYNAQASQVFYRNNCAAGYAGTAVTYLVPAAYYVSTISQPDADAQAQAEISANGQVNANALGTCVLICTPANCTGVDKKCVNNICETGIKVYTSSVQIGPHLYECTYHYEWSDGSWSQNYIEQSPTPCIGPE